MSSRASILMAASLFLAGCGSSSTSSSSGFSNSGPTASEAVVLPQILVEGPAPGTAYLKTPDGVLLGQADAPGGLASISAPADGDVLKKAGDTVVVSYEVTDPTLIDAGPGACTFYAETTLSGQDTDFVQVNPVTTAIALRHHQHPEETLDQSAAAFFQYLGLPADSTIQSVLEGGLVDWELVYAAARRAGGFNLLAEQIGNGGNVGPLLTSKPPAGFISDLPTNIAKCALSFGASKLFGWLGSKIGIPGTETHDVTALIGSVRADIAALSAKLDSATNIILYHTADAALVADRSEADSYNEDITEWIANANNPPSEEAVATKMAEISTKFNGTLKKVADLEAPPDTLKKGLTTLYLDEMGTSFLSPLTADKFADHFKRSSLFQALVLNLLIESYHYQNPLALSSAELRIGEYFATVRKMRQLAPLEVLDPQDVMYDRRTNLLWTRRTFEIQDAKTVETLVKSYEKGGGPGWRVPSEGEVRSIFDSIHLPAIDQHQNFAMKEVGFLPKAGKTQVGDSTGFLEDSLNFRVVTNLRTPLDERGRLVALGTAVDLRNARSNGVTLQRDTFHERHNFALLLCKTAPTVDEIIVQEKSRTSNSVSYRAYAIMTDDSVRDGTDLVVWSTNVPNAVAHISNEPDSSGKLTFRTSGATGVNVTGNFVGARTQPVAAPVLTFFPRSSDLLLSPARRHVPTAQTYPLNIGYSATLIYDNGAQQDVHENPLTHWSTDDPSVTISDTGLLTVATRPAVSKNVTVTCTWASRTQTAVLRIDH